MSYTKKLVCLANSGKPGGFCFAGKEMSGAGYGPWIRPVSAQDGEGISRQEQTFANGGCPQILDVVTVPMIKPIPVKHQRENHLIDSTSAWERTDALDRRELPELLDDIPGALWINGSSSRKGCNDRISPEAMRGIQGSLLLIRPDALVIIAQWNTSPRKLEVRADFTHNENHYNLGVTDPVIEHKYRKMSGRLTEPRHYSLAGRDVYLCVSLAGQPCQGYYYKLAAGLVGDPE